MPTVTHPHHQSFTPWTPSSASHHTKHTGSASPSSTQQELARAEVTCTPPTPLSAGDLATGEADTARGEVNSTPLPYGLPPPQAVETSAGEVPSTPSESLLPATGLVGTAMGEVISTPRAAQSSKTVIGEVSSTPMARLAKGHSAVSPTPIKCCKPFETITSPYPAQLQTDIVFNKKPNRTHIQQRVDSLLLRYGQQSVGISRMSLHGNLLIPSPSSLPDLPFWGFRASNILPQHLMDHVISTMADAEAAGCHPHINPLKKAQSKARKRERQGLPPLPQGGARSDYEVPFHIGVFKHPSRIFDQPWITKDTLQGLSGDTQTRQQRISKMMALCKAIDNMVNGRVQRLIGQISPGLLGKYREFARLRSSTTEIIRHDMDDRLLPAELQKYGANRWPFLRFGNLGTTVAIGRGQSEKLHLDIHDDQELPTILMVLGNKDNDWDHSDGQGDIILPTLGLSIPLYPGDIFIFYASLLPHQVKLLPSHERHKRTVATLFTCSPTRVHLKNSEARGIKRKQRDEEIPDQDTLG